MSLVDFGAYAEAAAFLSRCFRGYSDVVLAIKLL